MKHLLTLLGLTLIMGANSGCLYESTPFDSESMSKAKQFKKDLIVAISESERISIVEHSWIYDFRNSEGELLVDSPLKEYRRVELSPQQKSELLKVFETMSDTPKTVFSLCTFEPHHTLEIYGSGSSKSAILVCFTCADTEWADSTGTAPTDFQSAFQGFIEPLGFQASREWRALANEKT